MSNVILFGIVLAIAAILVYVSRKLGAAESDLGQEKATSQGLQEVANSRISDLEKSQLDTETTIRTQEREEEHDAYAAEVDPPRSSIGFYPPRLRKHPKDPNDLN